MKILVLAIALCILLLNVWAQDENELIPIDPLPPIDCAAVSCIQIYPYDCPCGLDTDGCCPTCCTDCVECLVDPCENYSCLGYPGYTCRSNYCHGCNREWFNSQGEQVECPSEIFGIGACDTVRCALPECECGFVTNDDSCCPTCCDTCAECFVDPCTNRVCEGNPDYRCQANYCNGCNRDWFNSQGEQVTCPSDTIVTANSNSDDWLKCCDDDSDCALKDPDFGFDCCSRVCYNTGSLSDWKPVNVQWWEAIHNACAVVSDCEPTACIAIYVYPDYEPYCKNNRCKKRKISNNFDNFLDAKEVFVSKEPNYQDKEPNQIESSSSSLLAVTMLALAFWLLLL